MKIQKRAKITARCKESEYKEFLASTKENGMNQTDLVPISIKELMKSHNRRAQRPEDEDGIILTRKKGGYVNEIAISNTLHYMIFCYRR